MQFAKVNHLEFVLEAKLQFVDNVPIACQIDEVVFIYEYNHKVVTSL